MIRIREAVFPADYPVMTEVLTAEHGPEWPVQPEALAAEDAARDPRFVHIVLLAEIDGEAAGVGSIGHIPFAHQEGRFQVDLRVRPERQGQGVGKALYRALLERITPFKPRELVAEVWEGLPRPTRFVEERGYRLVWRRIDSKVDVRTVDRSPFDGLEGRLMKEGISVVPVSEMDGEAEWERKLWSLDWALMQDVPSDAPRTPVSLEQFVGETIRAPGFLTDACFIARQGKEWIGYSNLLRGESYFLTQMTGVLPAWRGKGVATLLKLKGITYAQAHGGLELRTTNDETNAAMLELNKRLGFQPVGAMRRYLKKLD